MNLVNEAGRTGVDVILSDPIEERNQILKFICSQFSVGNSEIRTLVLQLLCLIMIVSLEDDIPLGEEVLTGIEHGYFEMIENGYFEYNSSGNMP